jgi:hypothetical protein
MERQMPTGRSQDVSDKEYIASNVGVFGLLAGTLALAFYCSSSTQVSEKEAICVQTGPTSFQIIDIQDPGKPLVLWDVAGNYNASRGIADRKLVTAFIDSTTFRVNSEFTNAEMDLEKGSCAIWNGIRSVEPHTIRYKLEKHPYFSK